MRHSARLDGWRFVGRVDDACVMDTVQDALNNPEGLLASITEEFGDPLG